MKNTIKLRRTLATALGIGGAVAVGCSVCCLPFVAPLLLTLLASAGIYCYDDIPGTWIAGSAGVVVLSLLAAWILRRRRERSKDTEAIESCACKASCKP
ncbi:hypothetical protein LJR289_004319 [Pseudoduganella sp. LjRoot289]|uniref:hypothetical protein n=1 Tax=Pseudoduganella sp. LjRoot289 TaxID=3342314 RepID=UPI003ECEDBBA